MHCLVFPEKGYLKNFIFYEGLGSPKSRLSMKANRFLLNLQEGNVSSSGWSFWRLIEWLTENYTWWDARFYSVFAVVNFRKSTFDWGGKNGEMLRFFRNCQKYVLLYISGYTEASSMWHWSGWLVHSFTQSLRSCFHAGLVEVHYYWFCINKSALVSLVSFSFKANVSSCKCSIYVCHWWACTVAAVFCPEVQVSPRHGCKSCT